jgi:hypothetical protein
MTRSQGLHEDFRAREAVKAGSDRTFGLVMAGACAVLAALAEWREHQDRAHVLVAAAVIFAVLGLTAPRLLGPLNRLWFRFGLLLNQVISPAALAIVFFAAVTPVALLMRLRRVDPLRLRLEKGRASYWIERTPPGPAPGTMRNQF